jgi:predicted nucleotidyltransferase
MIEAEYFDRKCLEKFGENLVSVVLFGSRSRGTATARSDIDFIIILEREGDEEIIRNLRIDFIMKFSKKIDTICLTRNDALQNFKNISPLFATLALGIEIFYDKNAFFKEQFKKFVKIIEKTKIKYYEGDMLWDIPRICSEILL